MQLKKLVLDDYNSFIEMANDYSSNGRTKFEKYCNPDGFKEYLKDLKNFENISTVPDSYVPSICFFLVDHDGRFIGSTRLRTKLNKKMIIEGGNIGYDIRPSFWNKGFGTKILALCLVEAKMHGLVHVLVTCDTDNEASARVIEKNGGILESIETSPRTGKATKRFWIDLNSQC
jgi:predicted acetyltransferase